MLNKVQPSTLPSSEAEVVEQLRQLTVPHVGSFGYALGQGLRDARQEIEPVYLEPEEGSGQPTIEVAVEDLSVIKPRHNVGNKRLVAAVYPHQSRESHSTYKADLFGTLSFRRMDTGEVIDKATRRIGSIPIMVFSSQCNLSGLSPSQLAKIGEEEFELGGYFIINGVEKVVRMVIVNKRQHLIGIRRPSNANRGALYSDAIVSIRCCRGDQTSKTNHLHYLTSGGANLRLTIRRQEFFLPVVLLMKALLHEETSDRDIFERLVGYDPADAYLRDRALSMIKDASDITRGTRGQILSFLGSKFRTALRCPKFVSDVDAGRQLLRQYVLVHLSTRHGKPESKALDACKVDLLVVMIRKLLGLVKGDVMEDSPDALMNQEILLPGHLYLMYLREKVEEYMRGLVAIFDRDVRVERTKQESLANMTTPKYLQSLLIRNVYDLTRKMEYFLATGNLQTQTGLDLLQASGYSVVAERINFWRFIAHFRCVHRGQFFNDVKTTSVRKLLPDAWGFICPVHTPDGAPCGLLNHFTASAFVSLDTAADGEAIESLVAELGAFPASTLNFMGEPRMGTIGPIIADGRVVGHVELGRSAEVMADRLRAFKLDPSCPALPAVSEISFVPRRSGGLYPGLYIFTSPARLMRPVKWLRGRRGPQVEFVGAFEQIHLRIRGAVRDDDDPERADDTVSHEEVAPTGILSVLASLTPFSDMNQSPRNMYQCQMGKQALGTPCHMYGRRTDSKTYRFLTGQCPITRNRASQDKLGFDLFPNGVNAVVAVISYTGYDMEDAMVINKSSLERGFCQAYIYTTHVVDLDEIPGGKNKRFGCLKQNDIIAADGLPQVGSKLSRGDPMYCIVDDRADDGSGSRSMKFYPHKAAEVATVDQVRLLAPTSGSELIKGCRRAVIRLRYRRDPVIGDKFASRAGQKGTLSCMWPESDMPFSESGIIPDIIFNPNGFPSRMTIGMMVESMCGKSGAVHGVFQDSTPFRFDENRKAADYFGEQLLAAGYNYYGNEMLYSGYTGEPFEVEIFTGVVHYQRLRHMVSDKFQVRSTGPINPLTRQPVKGRKVGGAIRFGEMERDALLGHGAAFLLHDRLSTCSDLHTVWICASCRSVLSPISRVQKRGSIVEKEIVCRVCGPSAEKLRRVNMPYVFKYLANELAAMGVRTLIDVA